MRRTLVLVGFGCAILVAALGLASARGERAAPGARYIRASIELDGREILRGSTSDDGKPDVDEVWGYLRGIEFTPTEELAKLGLATDAAELALERKGEPGAIVLALAYGGEARTWRLALLRTQDEKGHVRWKLAPAEIERLFPVRLIARSEAAHLRDPQRSR